MTSDAEIHVQVDRQLFNEVYLPYLDNMARIQILYGGAGSGKSRFQAQRVVLDILKGGRNYLVCRAVAGTVKRSVWTEIRGVITRFGLWDLFDENKTNLTLTCVNGYQILFTGLDDAEKIKSIVPEVGAITDIWIEEATEVDRQTVKSLLKRQRGGDPNIPKRLTLTFNPILRTHWIFEEYFAPIGWADDQTEYNGDELVILKTWYIHNRFLTESDVKDLENEDDPYYYEVYTLGNWGVLGHVIFTNWETRDLSALAAQFVNRRNGLDFGFSSNPAGLVVTHYDQNHKVIYLYRELYETDLTNDVLAERILDTLDNPADPVTCDSAEPKSIAELLKHGVLAIGAKKGKDSVNHGIQWLKQQKIVVDKRCVSAQNEFRQYKWKEDKNGNRLPVPVDKNNHLIDALRYAYEGDMIGGVTTTANPFYD